MRTPPDGFSSDGRQEAKDSRYPVDVSWESLVARLSPLTILRVHRSHAVNVQFVRELRPQLHGEYLIALSDGTELTSGRGFRVSIQAMFGLG